MLPTAATIDAGRVARLREETVGWQHKAVPPRFWGATVADMVRAAPRVSDLATPLVTVSEPAIASNVAAMASWVAQRGLLLAPHGKTTMAPALWSRQLAAGAWAITVANPAQLAVARAFGVSRVMVANEVVTPSAVRWLADLLAEDASFEASVWADSADGVAMLDAALRARAASRPGAEPRPLDVLVEVGAPGGRAGARGEAAALDVAHAVRRSATLRLAGVAGYEGAVGSGAGDERLAAVRDYLRELASVHRRFSTLGLYPGDVAPVVTAGGSAYFDLVADELGPLAVSGARVVLRAGAYVTHDDGFYRRVSPLGEHPRVAGRPLLPALHAWASVISRPEPALALLDAGKRDLPYDEGLPEVQLHLSQTGETRALLGEASVVALNDQHAFVRLGDVAASAVKVGDRVRLGLSHPCTAFDKWSLVPVIDAPDAEDPRVVDLIRTFF